MRAPLWVWWAWLVILLSAPWFGFTATPQWDRLNLQPLGDPQDKPSDLILNVGLFVPFGFSFLKNSSARRRMLATIGAAALVSVCAELPQMFSTARHPSTTDVLAAVLGAAAGGGLRRLSEKNMG